MTRGASPFKLYAEIVNIIGHANAKECFVHGKQCHKYIFETRTIRTIFTSKSNHEFKPYFHLAHIDNKTRVNKRTRIYYPIIVSMVSFSYKTNFLIAYFI